MRLSLKNAKLYLVLDTDVSDYDLLFEVLRKAVAAGVDIVQLRDKGGNPKDIIKFSERALEYLKRRVPFIINDRLDIAMACGADGVHLGQEDLPVEYAKKIMGKNFILGTSCQTVDQAVKAQRLGVDYIGFGSVFKTPTKVDRPPMDLNILSQVLDKVNTPIFAIGGINLANIGKVLPLGISRVAVTRVICLSADIKKTVKEFRDILDK